MASPIMVVTLSVNPEDEAEFNDFYHHQFLPEMLHEVPDITCIRRYEEHGVGGTLRWYNKQYLTIYELVSERVVPKVDEFFTRPRLKSVMEKFQEWKTKSLRNFTRITYLPRWEHDRKSWDGAFGSRPFFLWSLEMKPEMDSAFQDWYENDYLPLQVADIPTWAGVRRYTSVKRDPVRHLTFFEAEDEQVLIRCLTELRSAHRINQNYEWNRRVEPAVSWHDATSFRPIYRRPG
jgi:hypothetical protein